MKNVKIIAAKIAILIFAFSAVVWATPPPPMQIGPTPVSEPGKYSGYSKEIYKGAVKQSIYVTMRDGVEIAIDYYLPKGLPASEKIPAILIQTRYWRNMVVNMRDNGIGEYFVRHGYALVSVDVRGTGASFGNWLYPWTEAETKDGAEIVDWIIRQPWSNGLIGTYGTSYMGATAEFLLVNHHPAVKAAAVRYSLYDAYTDVAFPGGIRQDWFLDMWNRVNHALDANDAGAMGQMMGILPFHIPGIPGVSPAGPENTRRQKLRDAVLSHKNNGDLYAESKTIEYRDDYSKNWNGTFKKISPYSFKNEIESSGAAIYSYSGWYDGPYTGATVNRYLNISNPKKLLLGPWPHGGHENISPFSPTRKNDFDHNAEMLRFFDYHLKGIKNGIMEEAPVRYYTMGEEKWKNAQSWPPPSTAKTYYLSTGHGLSADAPKDEAYDNYKVDYTAGSGHASRYDSLLNLKNVPIGYPDRVEADKKLLVYETAPLDADIEVTGHPVIKLYVSSTATDGQFFVYLEDVSPEGKVSYITEGVLRAACRAVSSDTPPFIRPPGMPNHTFNRADAKPLVPGEIEEIIIDLQPTSVLFMKGHRIRVAVAGADKDHFGLPPMPEPEIKIYRSRSHLSAIELPVVNSK